MSGHNHNQADEMPSRNAAMRKVALDRQRRTQDGPDLLLALGRAIDSARAARRGEVSS